MHTTSALQARLDRMRDLESQLTFRLAVISKRLDQQASEILKDTPLSLASYRILSVVRIFEQVSISDISRFNAIDRAQVSRTATDLEKLGFVHFKAAADSKRKKMVILTDAGQAIHDQVLPRFEERRRRLEQELGARHHDALLTGLNRLGETIAPRG